MSGAIQATATAADQHQVEQVTVSIIPVVKEVARAETKDLEVLVRVVAPTKATKRVPIDIVAVLDVSDSMNWLPHSNVFAAKEEQSRLDLLKVAMKFVLKNLQGGDRLATVAFNNDVVTEYTTELKEISADRREAELDFVDTIVANHGTMFGPALDRAVETLKKRTDKSRPGFILFLSDGEELIITEDNKKSFPEKYRTQIAWDEVRKDPQDALYCMLREYPVHAFGFSKFHDPKAMHAIATLSGGTYSFLNDGLDKITNAFGFCLGGLQTVVAADIKINLTVQNQESVITGIDSGGYDNSFGPERDGKFETITIPVLYAGEVKEFIVRLKVPPCSGSKQLLVSIDGRCDTWGSHGRVRVDAQIPDDNLIINRPPTVGKDQQQQDEKVLREVLQFKVLKMLSGFLQDMKSRPVDLKKEKGTAAKSLSVLWDSVKAENKSMDESLIKRYDQSVKEMLASLQNGHGDGGAFIYSWKSSTGMQRVTTMGSPDKVILDYMTPAIRKMEDEAKKSPAEILAPPPPPPPPEEGPDVTKPAVSPEYRPWPCACLEFDMVGQQLAYWAVVKRDLLRLVEQVEGNGGHHHLTGTFHDLELASINRAMYESVFLAVEHGHNLRSSYCAATGRPHLAACYDGEER